MNDKSENVCIGLIWHPVVDDIQWYQTRQWRRLRWSRRRSPPSCCCTSTLSSTLASALAAGNFFAKTRSQLVVSFQFQSWRKVLTYICDVMFTNKVKSYQKITETVQTAKFSEFPLIFCRNGPKWTKTLQTQTAFLLWKTISEVCRIPHESSRPGEFKNVMGSVMFYTRVIAVQNWVKFQGYPGKISKPYKCNQFSEIRTSPHNKHLGTEMKPLAETLP